MNDMLLLKIKILISNRRQYEIAEAAGIHPTRLSRILTGVAAPNSRELQRLKEALDISDDSVRDAVATLLGGRT